MVKITYPAVVEESDDGLSIYFPDLPGCVGCRRL
jgi:predicted RNase H-like HicB family nuclease